MQIARARQAPRARSRETSTRPRAQSENLVELVVDLGLDRPLEHAKEEREVDLHAHFLFAYVDRALGSLGRAARRGEHDAVALPAPLELELLLHRARELFGALAGLFLGERVRATD